MAVFLKKKTNARDVKSNGPVNVDEGIITDCRNAGAAPPNSWFPTGDLGYILRITSIFGKCRGTRDKTKSRKFGILRPCGVWPLVGHFGRGTMLGGIPGRIWGWAIRTLALPKSFSLAHFANLDGPTSAQLSAIEAALADKSRGEQSDFH